MPLLWAILINLLPLSVLFFLYYKWKYSYWQKRGVPGPTPYPFLGNIPQTVIHGAYVIDQTWVAKYGKIFGTYRGFTPSLSICDVELVKQVLIRDFSSFSNRGKPVGNHPIWKENAFSAQDEAWKRIRKIISPSFTSGKLRGMAQLMNESVNKLNNYFETLSNNKVPFEVKKVISGFTIDVIASTSFATDTDSNGDRQKENPIVYHGNKIFRVNIFRFLAARYVPEPFKTWLRANSGFKPEHLEFFVNLTKTILDDRRKQSVRRNDLLQLLIDAEETDLDMKEDGNLDKLTATGDNCEENTPEDNLKNRSRSSKIGSMSDNEIIAQSILFFIAGFETTATTLTHALFELARNQDVQERLLQEIQEKVAHLKQDSLEYYDTVNNSIPYLNAFVKETLRKYSPASRLNRTCAVDGYNLGGIELYKGQAIDIPVYPIHYDPEYYPDPHRFDPQRFMMEDSKKLPYLSFGQGPRNCIGMRFAYVEIKLCLAHVVRNFRFIPAPTTPLKLRFVRNGVVSSLPFDLCLEKRQ